MKPNRFKQLLREGITPIGHMLSEFRTRGIAQILAVAGVDFVVIDMEHGSFTLSETADMIAWLKATPVAPFVRVPEVQYHHIARVMDAGALGVVAPNVKSAAEARASRRKRSTTFGWSFRFSGRRFKATSRPRRLSRAR